MFVPSHSPLDHSATYQNIYFGARSTHPVSIDLRGSSASVLFHFLPLAFAIVRGPCGQVRGAPLIAIVAALGLAVEVSTGAEKERTAEEASAVLYAK